jgi:hypothetical protein
MNKDYNARQRKIYNDYNSYSTENLLEILQNRQKFIPAVINIVNDILSERNAIYPSAGTFNPGNINNDTDLTSENKNEAFFTGDKLNAEEVIKSFADKLKEKSPEELNDIVTKYTSYRIETVKAALIVSVDKGIISYELKENLLDQIETNLASHNKRPKQENWKTNNAFRKYVSGYEDDKIYNIIEDPGGIVIDVYHAILSMARERELISENDFEDYFQGAKSALRSDAEIKNEEIEEFFGGFGPASEPLDEAELEKEAEKYWTCPSCNEMVDMELGVCWNCQTEIPETIKHPDKEEIIKERAREKIFNPVRTGFILIAGGIFVVALSYWRYHDSNFLPYYYSPRFWLGVIFALAGVGFVLFGLFLKKDTQG